MWEITLIREQLGSELASLEAARSTQLNDLADMVVHEFVPFDLFIPIVQIIDQKINDMRMLYEMACEAESDYEDSMLYWQNKNRLYPDVNSYWGNER